MMRVILILCCVVGVIRSETPEAETHEELHSSLLHKLLKGYDKLVLPNEGKNVHINISTFFTHLEWHDHDLEAVFFIRHYWHDQRLEAQTKTKLKVDADDIMNHIWTPDTFSPGATSKKVLEHGFISIYEGNVVWSQLWKVHVPCPTTTRDLFISDGHVNCTIPLESYSHNVGQVDIEFYNPVRDHKDHHHQENIEITYDHKITELSVGNFDRLLININMQTLFKQDVLKFVSNGALKKFS